LDASGRGARELAIAYQHDRVVKAPARSISKRQFLMKSAENSVENSFHFFTRYCKILMLKKELEEIVEFKIRFDKNRE